MLRYSSYMHYRYAYVTGKLCADQFAPMGQQQRPYYTPPQGVQSSPSNQDMQYQQPQSMFVRPPGPPYNICKL